MQVIPGIWLNFLALQSERLHHAIASSTCKEIVKSFLWGLRTQNINHLGRVMYTRFYCLDPVAPERCVLQEQRIHHITHKGTPRRLITEHATTSNLGRSKWGCCFWTYNQDMNFLVTLRLPKSSSAHSYGWAKHRWWHMVQLKLACQEVLEWVWPSMNWNMLLFIQVQTLPPHMQSKWKEITAVLYPLTHGKS